MANEPKFNAQMMSIFASKAEPAEPKQEKKKEKETKKPAAPEPASESESEPELEEEPQIEKKPKSDSDDDLEQKYFDNLEKPQRVKESKVQLSEAEKKKSTVFFGNVPNTVITDKAVYRQFSALVSKYGKVHSIRFRSIAFSEQLPRRAAFAMQKLHESRDAVNAYVVYSTPEEAEAALELNSRVFLDHHLRADSVSKPALHVPKRSVFLGNMDFEQTEEPLYRHFESAGEIEFVRIIRDKKTNVGRGFGYVQFTNPDSVTLALQMNNSELGGRELRVQAAKRIKPNSNKTDPAGKAGRVGADGRRISKAERRIIEKEEKLRPKKQRISKDQNVVFEGARAKEGEKAGLGRKKPRHRGIREARAKKFALNKK